ncbi:MAG: hypothetical protein PUF12_11545 [Thermoflexaceae bacterium]|nr:hypothetical protein [Thermoflexaceae bacterium]
MVLLSNFIGELVADISDARRVADANSIALSQTYHADPFLKGMPVPHYTIDEAEISFPLTVLGVSTGETSGQQLTSMVMNSIKLKLPQMLTDEFRNCYVETVKEKKRKAEEEKQASAVFRPALTDAPESLEDDSITVTKVLVRQYASASNRIAQAISEPMRKYLETANFEMVKLLDIKDQFMVLLRAAVKEEVALMEPKHQPVTTEEVLDTFVDTVGRFMFFEFKQYEDKEHGILVDPGTGKMNEYGNALNLMNIKIKVKEQDLDIVVADGDGKNSQRFLSLN